MCPIGSSDTDRTKAYDDQIKYLKNWLHGRIEWLKTNIAAL